jgi:hypothetical protein
MLDPFRTPPFPSVPLRSNLRGSSAPPIRCTPSLLKRGVHRKGGMTKSEENDRKNDPLPLHSQNHLPDEGFWPRIPIAEVADHWVVLRCASLATIELAEELREEHILAWSPIVRIQRRLPRRRKTELVTKPLLPSFIFVAKQHADHAIELATKGAVHQCKRFLFNVDEVVVPGIQLAPLHQAQIRGTLRKRPLVKGDRVEILATLFYLHKASVVKGPLRNDSYEVQLDGQNQLIILPGFLLRKTSL